MLTGVEEIVPPSSVADMPFNVRPATDMALILAWINIIISEGLYDKEYISSYATGLDELRTSRASSARSG